MEFNTEKFHQSYLKSYQDSRYKIKNIYESTTAVTIETNDMISEVRYIQYHKDDMDKDLQDQPYCVIL